MAFTFETNSRGPDKDLGTRIAAWLASRWQRLLREIAVRRTHSALESLPDWILRDIGVSRSGIAHLSRAVNEPPRDGVERPWRYLS